MAAHIVKPELLAQEIGQRASVNELAAVIQQPGDIRNGRRLRQRPLDLVLRVHAASMRFARSIVQLYLRVKGSASPALCRMALSVPTGTSLPSWPGTVTINTLSRMPELISQHSAHFHAWIHYPAASQRWPERYTIEVRVIQ